jgi:hypothetical protein
MSITESDFENVLNYCLEGNSVYQSLNKLEISKKDYFEFIQKRKLQNKPTLQKLIEIEQDQKDLETIKKIIKDRNNGLCRSEAVAKYNWTLAQFSNKRRKLQNQGVIFETVKRKGKSSVNLNWFEEIDTEAKAYFLGLIFADGCIHIPNSGRSSKVLSIKLKEEDGYILDKLASFITPERKSRLVKPSTKSLGNGFMYQWAVNSDKIFEDLIKLGLHPRKSTELKLRVPLLNKELLKHFVRGFFDGNGYISLSDKKVSNKYTYNSATFGIISTSKCFLEDIQELIFQETGVLISITEDKKEGKLTKYRLVTSSLKSVKCLYSFLYGDSNLFLYRKKSKFDTAMSW